ncbi:MAG: hypothetical protein PHX30_04695 [Candidatus Pacebacteria bacterium]|jgi:hypothetical protein|nr:hypothetical protein [Candidatus Paceibacterota bacterium]
MKQNCVIPGTSAKLEGLLVKMYVDLFTKTYKGPYPKETMRELLRPLFNEEEGLNWNFFLRLLKRAFAKYDQSEIVRIEGENQEVFITVELINAVLGALEAIGELTFDFFKGGKVFWVCRENPNGSFYSCLCVLSSHSSFERQLYFLKEVEARSFLKAFREDIFLNGGKEIFLVEAISSGRMSFQTNILC